MTSGAHHVWSFVVIAAVAVVGYGIMHLLFMLLPVSQDTRLSHVALSIVIIGLGLAIPYWMLKIGFSDAHKGNPREKSLHLSDLPRDGDDIGRD